MIGFFNAMVRRYRKWRHTIMVDKMLDTLANMRYDEFVEVAAESIFYQNANRTGNIIGWVEQPGMGQDHYRNMVEKAIAD